MVARITFGKNIAGVLAYNKLKVDNGTADIMLCHNLPVTARNGDADIAAIAQAFKPWIEHPASRLAEPVFHVSLNPHPDDKLDDMQLLEIAQAYMEKMGYGEQPYVVFRHADIEREHLHIVSSRVKADGSAVDYFRYKRRSVAATKEIERDFGLHPAVTGESMKRFTEIRHIEYVEGDIKARLGSVLLELRDSYKVGSLGEWNALLGLFNIYAEECTGEASGKAYEGMIYGVIDEDGERIGKPIKASRFHKRIGYKAMTRQYASTKKWIKENKALLEPVKNTIRKAMAETRTPEKFTETIRSEGLSVVFRTSKEHAGRIYGVTFIDHNNRIVINGSKLDKAFAANQFHKLFSISQEANIKHGTSRTETIPGLYGTHTNNDDTHGRFWLALPKSDIIADLLDEATRPEPWEEQYVPPKKKRKKYRPQ